jgi:hypothetical protein
MVTKEPISKSEISLKEFLENIKGWYNFLFSKWKTIVIAGAIGGILGLVISFTTKPQYTANLTFAIEGDNSAGSGGVLSLASQFGLSLGGTGGGIFEGTNLNELFKSRSMVEKTLMQPVLYKGIRNGENIGIQNQSLQKFNFYQIPRENILQEHMTVFWE